MPSSDSLQRAIVDRMAAQWIALGCLLAGEADVTIVDLEALIAVTAETGAADARVYEAALDWCLAYGHSVNTARLKNVAAEIAVRPEGLAVFAGALLASGGPRWPFARGGRSYESRGKVAVRDLEAPSRLLWRLRSAFGVNARADVLAALLTMPEPAISVAELAHRTRFTKRNVALAARSMRLAGVVEIDRVGNEDRAKLAPSSPLRGWLCPRPITPLIDWPARWRIAHQTHDLLVATAGASPTVRAVEGRASLESLRPLLGAAALPVPDMAPVGPAFAVAYDAWADAVEVTLRSVGG